MIKSVRHSLIILTSAFLSWSLFRTGNPVFAVPVMIYGALWLAGGVKFPFVSLAALPVNLAAVLAGLLSGGSELEWVLIFLLLLGAWETDQLSRDINGANVEGGQFRLLLPLFIRELSGSALVLFVYFITKDRDLSIGFWPPVLFAVLLILLMRKLFKAGNS